LTVRFEIGGRRESLEHRVCFLKIIGSLEESQPVKRVVGGIKKDTVHPEICSTADEAAALFPL
jgi:hypothetical protein